MSVAGFDIGDQCSCIAVARKRGIDVLMNKESKRETPSIAAFNSKQRLLGTAAVGSLSTSPKNTVFQIKRLLGKKFSNPDVQRDIAKFPFEVTEGSDGNCLITVDYLGEKTQLTAEQLLAMVLVDQKEIAETDGSPVTDCVISVPTYFTEAERYAALNAAQIAGVNCLRLFNDTTSTALAYGIYKTDLPETEPSVVAFVDIGYSALQVSIVAFTKGKLQVLAHAWDRNLGGRDFDEVLFDHFCEEFGAKHKIDIKSNARASFRLRLACEKMKKVFSANPEATINVECIMNDIDVAGRLSRDVFEEKSASVLERVRAPLQKALDDAQISQADVHSVEVVGGSSRVPALLRIIKDFFDKEPGRTLNAKECVSKGAALNCAMLSPIFRVRDFEVIDSYPFGVEITWEKDGAPHTETLFKRAGPIPSSKMLTFFREQQFELQARYTSDSPVPESFGLDIGRFVVGPPKPSSSGDKVKLKVKVKLNLHGVVGVESVQQVDEEEYEEKVKRPVVKETKPTNVPNGKPADKPTEKQADESMDGDAPSNSPSEDGTPPSSGEATPMETEQKDAAPQEIEEVIKKKRTRKTNVNFSAQTAGMKSEQLTALYEKECNMALQDRVQEQTNEAKNALEAYVYGLRNKLYDQLSEFVTNDFKESTSKRLEQMEDWLYEEGEDEIKSTYVAKLNELRQTGDPVERRAIEFSMRPRAAESLQQAAHNFASQASSSDPKYSHIPAADKKKVLDECQAALGWLEEKKGLQETMKKTDDPVLVTADIKKKEETLTRVAEPILNKPPPKKEEPKPEAKTQPEANATAQARHEDMDAEPSQANPETSTEEPMEQ
ncbi:hypothetical protein ABBQ32_001221 [Trebouxia sp. C0010 RCD-2024]